MNLSTKNWFARYYNWIYDEHPKDVCSFFWGLLLIIGLSFILIPGKIWKGDGFARNLGSGILNYVIYFILWMIGIHYYTENILNIKKFNYSMLPNLGLSNLVLYVWIPLFGLGITIAVFILLSLFLGIPYGVWKLITYTSKSAYSKVSNTTFSQNTKDFIGAIRGKYCTRITWKD